jgi:hypothetical protein
MSQASDASSARWYDKDPALSQALGSLRQAPDRFQAQIALNIIKVIVEHRMETLNEGPVIEEAMQAAIESTHATTSKRLQQRRWYDVNETLRAAMQLLSETPEDVQQMMMPSIVKIIENALAVSLDDEE